MADTKLTALTELTAIANEDLIYVVDDPSGTPASRRATVQNVLRMAYGELKCEGNSTGQVLTANTWTVIDQWTGNGLSLNTTPSDTTADITVDNTGIYVVNMFCSFSGTGNSTIDLAIYWNGAEVAHAVRKLGASGDVGSASTSAIINVSTGSTLVEPYVRADGNDTFTMEEGRLQVFRIA